jgi:broad specificity phosphatase PhoE
MNSGFKKTTGALKRKPFLTPVWLAAIAAVIVLSFATWLWGRADSTTVIVIRHAEKELNGSQDPPLSAAGEARAALLAHMFGSKGSSGQVTAIYVSPLVRNRMTAAPLAAALGIQPVEMPPDDPRALVRRVLKDNTGGRVLIVGHADTVPQIVALLAGGNAAVAPGDAEYGTMYIVTIPRIGRANVLHLSY